MKKNFVKAFALAAAFSFVIWGTALAAPGNSNGSSQDASGIVQRVTGQDTDSSSDADRPEPPEGFNGQRPERPDDSGKGFGHGGRDQLKQKIEALEDESVKADLLEKMEAAEEAQKAFMDAAKEAGIVDDKADSGRGRKGKRSGNSGASDNNTSDGAGL